MCRYLHNFLAETSYYTLATNPFMQYVALGIEVYLFMQDVALVSSYSEKNEHEHDYIIKFQMEWKLIHLL